MRPLIQLIDIKKSYWLGPSEVPVLRGASVDVAEGEFVAIVGASGSGKSTLLHIAGALDTPDQGRVVYRDQAVSDMSHWERHWVRNKSFGFVFQFYHLLPELNVLENVILPAMVSEPFFKVFFRSRPRKKLAMELLAQLGLEHRLKHRPAELSGGERQRAAIARALINQPDLLLADEPTGNLDSKTGRTIMDVIMKLNRERGQSVLLVTHDPHVASLADRVIELEDGRVVSSTPSLAKRR